MDNTNTKTVQEELKLYATRVRLARYWSQTAFSLTFLCLILLAWSLKWIPGELMFLNDGNRTVILWVSAVVGIVAFIFGFITFQGYKYGRSQLMEFIDTAEKKK